MKNKLKIINILNKNYKKILLIVLGFLMALMILEIAMQAAGFSMLYYRDYKNNKALKNKSKYKVMCLGESTTYGLYPKDLQKMLDQKYPGKFAVIDCGVPGTNLENILKDLDSNIPKYRPDIAICMMGINNEFVDFEMRHKPVYPVNCKIKIFKFIILLKNHIMASFKKKTEYFGKKDNSEKQHAYELYELKLYDEATSVFKNIIKRNPDDIDSVIFLAMIKYYYLNQKDSAYRDVLNVVQNNSKSDFDGRQTAYALLLDYKKDAKSRRYFANMMINDKNAVLNCHTFWLLKDFVTEEQKDKLLKKISEINQYLDQYYGLIAIEYMEKKNYQEAAKYFKKAEEIRLKHPHARTYSLYRLVVKKLVNNNIKVIIMQYPVRSIESLKKIFRSENYFDEIAFVSNENNFKASLKIMKYKDLFIDQFAGDFGHYTNEGSILIAENVMRALEKYQ